MTHLNTTQIEKPGQGENLYGSSEDSENSCERATTAFYNEKKYYDYDKPGFSSKTGNFTQVYTCNTLISFIEIIISMNVVRVLSRLRIIGTDSSSTVAVDTFWKLVNEIIVQGRPGDFNQAIMELGATICMPKSPQCNSYL